MACMQLARGIQTTLANSIPVKRTNRFIAYDSIIPNQSYSHVKTTVQLIPYWLFA